MLGLCFLTVTPCWLTAAGKRACAGRNPVLGEHVGGVLVRADLEIDVKQHAAVAGVRRLHVDHVIDAVDLLLDRSGHRLFDRFGGSAGIISSHANVRWGEERILLDREPANDDDPDQERQDRDNDGNDRAPDEKVRHGPSSLPESSGVD